ncbi:MAG: asparaginase domain-containing protein [Treponema sp.]|jgi:aspartyl-tRNA(Asn)/glutamyl-tRNA(Gln) amidotransferase subunit B|nr:asparaginase domain-containing protein [Treponema sp.]
MFKSYISLEVRILLPSDRKTFCSCGPDFAAALASCPVCRGEPGALPVLNLQALRKAYLLIRGLGGSILKEVPYERNQATPVMPEGHALSRLSLKLGIDAAMDIRFHRRKKHITITDIRLEEDVGRLIHGGAKDPLHSQETWMDYSRAGMPSLRIKTGANFEIGEEAEVFLSDLRRRIQYLELIPGTPLESLIRCNAYVAIAPYPEKPAQVVKLRNLNSFNFVTKAVNAELSRQEELVTRGERVLSESRLWNEAKNTLEFFQSRTHAEDKTMILLEDIPRFKPGPEIGEALDTFTVELPEARRNRLMDTYGLTLFLAAFVCEETSRADYFEQTCSYGAAPKEVAQWLASYLLKETKRLGFTLTNTPLRPKRFAGILRLLSEPRIHGSIAKQLITAVIETDQDPETLIKARGWEPLTDRKTIAGIVGSVINDNPQEVRRIREGDAGPIQFLTGIIMKETGGLAEPTLVKEVLKEQLSVSLVYVLSLGGAISGRMGEAIHLDGTLDRVKVRYESIPVGRILSEEIVPADWAALIETIADKLNSGTANGIVVAHGTDTLSYTAPLLYWLFADATAPLVLAASSTPPGASSEAAQTMKKAVTLALNKPKGVYVVYGGKVLSPLNLKFERIGMDGFRNWNMGNPIFFGSSLLSGTLEADRYVLAQLLEDAVNTMCVIRIYPGLRADYLTYLIDKGVRTFFLELYDTGTAGVREGPYSLKRVFTLGRRRGVRFYCSAQQEGIVDCSGHADSRELWREGAVSMGAYTTETAVARFLAASIIADHEAERAALMEHAESENLELIGN